MGFGGAEQVFISLAKEWREHHQILFVTDRKGGSSFETLTALDFDKKSLEVNRTIFSILPFMRVVNEYKPDIIISAYPDTNAATIISAKLSSVKPKVIVSEHASIVDHFKHKSRFSRLKLNTIFKYVYPMADKVLSVSEGVMNDLLKIVEPSSKCTFIHNPVRFNGSPSFEISNNPASSGKILNLLAVGRVTPQKDYSTLLNAISLLVQQKTNLRLSIVGGVHDETEFNMLQALADKLGITEYISFEGFQSDMAKYYSEADIFVLSSAWEGFGNVIVEALAFGLPVVSTDCRSGPSEILESGRFGRLTEVGNAEAIAWAIREEIETPSTTYSERVRRASDFSEKVVSEKYLNLINETLEA